MRQAGLFGLSDHLKRLSADGDPLEELDRIVDFERFRPILTAVLAYGDGSKVADRRMIRWRCSRC
jgi:transposase, IS5 family